MIFTHKLTITFSGISNIFSLIAMISCLNALKKNIKQIKTYFFPTLASGFNNYLDFNREKNNSIGAVSKEYGALKITFIFNLFKVLRVISLV